MKVVFMKGGGKGEAEYDSSDGTYSWSYDRDDPAIENILSELEDGRHYSKIATDLPDSYDGDEIREVATEESHEPLPWDEQIKALVPPLERNGAEIIYLGE